MIPTETHWETQGKPKVLIPSQSGHDSNEKFAELAAAETVLIPSQSGHDSNGYPARGLHLAES